MKLLCKKCGETKPVEDLIKRKTKLEWSQSNVYCCKECLSIRNKKLYSTPEGRRKQLEANAKWRAANPDKMAEYTKAFCERRPAQQRARSRVGYLIRTGVWKRQVCCICGSSVQVEAHHDSYAEPHWDNVRWLCKVHHEKWHAIIDPIKKSLVDQAVKEAETMRDEAQKILQEVAEMRARAKSLNEKADAIELHAWNAAVEKFTPLFKNFK